MKRIAVLASGNGTNLQAVIDAIESGGLQAKIVLVLSDKKGAYALKRAESHGLKAVALEKTPENRERYFNLLLSEIEEASPDFIVLAGFMKILPELLLERFENRIINIHPSLLPSFGGMGLYGARVHKAVLESGARVTGCTVHFVSADVDGGPIIEQRTMEVKDTDNTESLSERIHSIEHPALVSAIALLVSGNYSIQGKRVIRPAGKQTSR